MDDFSVVNLTKITTNVKRGEDGLNEQRSFVGWKYGPYREKSSKWRCWTRPSSRWNLSLKLKIVFWKYLRTRSLGEIFDRIQLVPFFLTFSSEIGKENQNMFFSAVTKLSGIFGRNAFEEPNDQHGRYHHDLQEPDAGINLHSFLQSVRRGK